jgi:hypothetical protein
MAGLQGSPVNASSRPRSTAADQVNNTIFSSALLRRQTLLPPQLETRLLGSHGRNGSSERTVITGKPMHPLSIKRFHHRGFSCLLSLGALRGVTNSDSSASAAAPMMPASLPSVAGTISSFSQKVRSQRLSMVLQMG